MTTQPRRGEGTTPRPGPTVVYIGGYGRSGSTLLSRLLGENPDVFSAGELTSLGPGAVCSCGEPVERCVVWSRASSGSEASSTTAELVSRLASATGASVIVDSSGTSRRVVLRPWRAARAGVDIRFIHLIRDGRGVMWSRIAAARRRANDLAGYRRIGVAVRAVLAWDLANLAALMTSAALPRGFRTRITYEQVTAEPGASVAALERWIGLDPPAPANEGARTVPTGHEIGGNRHRFEAISGIRTDTAWRENLTALERGLYWVLGWPWALFHGRMLRHSGLGRS